ncbi:hypothetical protein Celal_1956 [Cellulophaga algicola DSM 14237]|uniref:Uncharacterized protein n=1 Tax=Cellulophaga algicola (strain DSM 14237 / IC166 / ACAM 630) TaxID=688270 RepID=E6XF32_CELAD|nr:hypothetical protein [Cellulophaga algicola]ADV49254.1 hypothetical protein Celal_1956 [Cellulophaga algicola DSM 14237]
MKSIAKKLAKDIKEDGKLFLAQAKLKGLNAVRAYVNSPSGGACGYQLSSPILPSIHCKVMSGEIKTVYDLENLDPDYSDLDDGVYFTYIFQIIKHNGRNITIIDSIISE